jgi:transposase InsO family protein
MSQRDQETMKRHGRVISMSRLGDPYDNAVMESFYKTLKSELLNGIRESCQLSLFRVKQTGEVQTSNTKW